LFKSSLETLTASGGRRRGTLAKRILPFLLAGLSGCASLPNMGPFVDASNQLRAAVATSGSTVESELRLMEGGAGFADQLKKDWDVRNEAFAGMAAYASSLKAIVDAGNEGAASARKVADSVSGLAKAAGVALPGSPEAVAVATDIVKFLGSQIALIRGTKSLKEAMATAQPAVQAIANLIAADLKDLEELFIAAAKLNDNVVRTSPEFKNLIGYRTKLLEQIGNSNPTDPGSFDQQVKLGQMLEATGEWHARYLAKRKEIDDRLRAGRALIQAAMQSANEWGVAHGQLLTALNERRPVNTDSILQAAVEIQTLVRKVREL
jgi:hypothetical protein